MINIELLDYLKKEEQEVRICYGYNYLAYGKIIDTNVNFITVKTTYEHEDALYISIDTICSITKLK